MIKIVEFDPLAASDALLESYFDLADEMFRELEPRDPVPPRELQKALLTESNPARQTFRWLALADAGAKEPVLGRGSVEFITHQEPDYESNKHVAVLNVDVAPGFRRQGLGTKLLRAIVDKAIARGSITVLETFSFFESGWNFCAKFGGLVALEAAQNRLELGGVDWEMIERWKAEGERRNKGAGVTIETFDRVPEEIIEEFVAIYNYTINQVPLGGLEMRPQVTPSSLREAEERVQKSGARWYTKAMREPDGKISGLTEIVYHPGTPHRVEQELTGVRAEYRGRGLGKWLKADMLLFIRDTLPGVEYVNTGNADSNAPMLSINQRMGFKKYQTEICYKFELQRLRSALG